MLTLYGISNCDTVRKAKKWLDAHQVDYRFHDFRKDGLTAADIESWQSQLGLEKLINKRGKTWRQLSDAEREMAENPNSQATELLLQYPALIKRPLLEGSLPEGSSICEVGFNETLYSDLINGVTHE